MTYPRQSEMGPKSSTLELEAQPLECDFDIMVQELQTGLLIHAHPYDTSSAKVREGSDATDAQKRLAVPASYGRQCTLNLVDTLLRLLTKKFQREMQSRL